MMVAIEVAEDDKHFPFFSSTRRTAQMQKPFFSFSFPVLLQYFLHSCLWYFSLLVLQCWRKMSRKMGVPSIIILHNRRKTTETKKSNEKTEHREKGRRQDKNISGGGQNAFMASAMRTSGYIHQPISWNKCIHSKYYDLFCTCDLCIHVDAFIQSEAPI